MTPDINPQQWKIHIIYAGSNASIDGIHQYSLCLARELRRAGVQASTHTGIDGKRAVKGLIRNVKQRSPGRLTEAVLVQYNSLSYGKAGIAPNWVWLLQRLRRVHARPLIAVTVHEVETPLTERSMLDPWRQLQDRMVCSAADLLFTPVERYAKVLTDRRPQRPVHHLVVGSNLEIASTDASRESVRSSLGAGGLVIGTLGLGHNHLRLTDLVAAAVNAVADAMPGPIILLNLGAAAREPDGLDSRVRVVSPGPLSAEQLSEYLGAVDVFLAPFADGISARRTSLIAALQHGLPIVGTVGPWTDALWRETRQAVLLVKPDDQLGFAAATLSLATDQERRVYAGRAAQALFEKHFSGPVICAELLSTLQSQALLLN